MHEETVKRKQLWLSFKKWSFHGFSSQRKNVVIFSLKKIMFSEKHEQSIELGIGVA